VSEKIEKRMASLMIPENYKNTSPVLKGKCTGCGMRSKKLICWRCETTLEDDNPPTEAQGEK